MKTHLSLFSGIGGLDLAAEWAGFETVGQCEWAEYPTKILKKYWPNVPKWGDIKTLTKESFYEQTGLRTIDIISGGFPCQPFSCAGKKKGKDDDRYLWPEMLRVVKELRPSWVVGENVAGIVSMELDQVLSDLEAQNYETRAFVVPACAVNAPHKRDRVAIVAYNAEKICTTMAYAASGKRDDVSFKATGKNKGQEPIGGLRCLPDWSGGDWKMPEPAICRMVNGVSRRLDRNRIKGLGNAVVPQQFYPIFKLIADICDGNLPEVG